MDQHKKAGVMAGTLNPYPGEVETGRSLGSIATQSSLLDELWDTEEGNFISNKTITKRCLRNDP